MDLGSWLDRESRTQAWLAEKCGVSQPTISRAIDGNCTLGLALRIQQVSGDQVTVADIAAAHSAAVSASAAAAGPQPAASAAD